MKYNERIREIREDHSLTQQKVADLLHIGQRTYADYESGKTRIPIDNIMILAKFYNVSMDYITGASNIRSEFYVHDTQRKYVNSLYTFLAMYESSRPIAAFNSFCKVCT